MILPGVSACARFYACTILGVCDTYEHEACEV